MHKPCLKNSDCILTFFVTSSGTWNGPWNLPYKVLFESTKKKRERKKDAKKGGNPVSNYEECFMFNTLGNSS